MVKGVWLQWPETYKFLFVAIPHTYTHVCTIEGKHIYKIHGYT